MATSSASVTAQKVNAGDDAALPGTRHISMWTDETQQDTMVKFLNVPDAYDLMDIKHADHAGMFYDFNNGETWLTLNNKRLFLIPDMNEPDIELGPEAPEDWPMMSPEELKLALAEVPSYEEMQGRFEAAMELRRAAEAKAEA